MRGKVHALRASAAITAEAWLLVAIIVATAWLLTSGTLAAVVEHSTNLGPLAGFVTGLLYSTFVTTPLAIGGFIALEGTLPAWQIALAGSLGATIIDLLLAKEMRSPIATLLVRAVVGHNVHMFRRVTGSLRWLAALFGAFLIAIPLPTDELGVVFLGASHLRALELAPIVFIADFIGIYGFLAVLESFF